MRLKGVVLAGEKGSRHLPLTKVTNKHLLPAGNAPIIWRTAWKMKQAGIEGTFIVTGTEHMGVVQETPRSPNSDLAVTGIFFFDGEVFDIVHTIRPSCRSGREISDVHIADLGRGKMGFGAPQGCWSDAVTSPCLAPAGELVHSEPMPFYDIPRGN